MAAPLYDRRYEHEACGLGAIARLDGRPSHEVVEQALTALANLGHRGATGADPDTGDGAGIMTQPPHRFLRGTARRELGHDLPEPGGYAVGIVFLPRDPGLRQRCEELCVRICAEEGHRALCWRDPPVRSECLGPVARTCEPVIRQLFVERRSGDEAAFERKLYVIRRRVERAAAAVGVPEAEFTIVSLSARRLVYKGLLTAPQLAGYYEDLSDPAFESALALVHSRFSTNTFGTWDLAHPFNLLAHNGEINTVRGNGNWLAAREPQLRSQLLGDDLQKLFPIAEERWSDSAKLDAAIELLVMGGRSLAHALTMLVPPARAGGDADDRVGAFHEYHAALAEPWDGPAAIVATDGVQVVAGLDRNGLRPLRFVRSRDGLLVVSSEVGVVDIDPGDIAEAGRVAPGRLLVADTSTGLIAGDREVRRGLARRRPYRTWLEEHRAPLGDLPHRPAAAIPAADRDRLLAAFGYTSEELELIVGVLAREGAEPVGSMGDDAPVAVLSERPRLLPGFFKQQFAQVTNPPIDPQREGLVMSLATSVGPIGNLLDERPEECRGVVCERPVLTQEELASLAAAPGIDAVTLSAVYRVSDGPAGLEGAVDRLCAEASRAVWDGAGIVILSDRGVDAELAPVPPLLATAAVHSHLVREGARTMCGLVVESGEPRETMHVALLVGYGAAAVCPYLALETLAERLRTPFVDALARGLLKVCSKMGISTVQSYRGAQIFEAVGLGPGLTGRYFPGTTSRVGGIELADLHADVASRHATAFTAPSAPGDAVALGSDYRYRAGGEAHAWSPAAITGLQRAVRDADPVAFRAFAAEVADASLRSLVDLVPAGPPLAVSDIEPAASIVMRFATGAMSLGAISPEAHETLAIAMNRLGGRSNSGEGGEDLGRSIRDPNGDLRRSAIKQVASGRFGVTAAYLVDADQLQIKIAQGAKPGEGGQLPGTKVNAQIAHLRGSLPGVSLISPPPHHDIYSIEDLAQLVHDLKCVNPGAEISVKLVAEAGVGTIAAGVAKAKAEHIVIAGHDGGTGAAPLGSIKHAGLPWELGLAEAHQVLVQNGLRDRVRLQVDGGLRTGRDVIVGAALGADEFGFSTAPLVAAGCVMMRVCHLNTCPVGIATQDPELRRRFSGTPEDVVRYFLLVAEQVRELLAGLGLATLDEAVGRGDLLRQRRETGGRRAGLDLAVVIATVPDASRSRVPRAQDHGLDAALDAPLIDAAVAAIERGEPIVFERGVRNTDRSTGARLAGEIARRAGPGGLPKGSVVLRLDGCAGQSVAAFAPAGLTIDLAGACNDYAGKGLSGGRLVVRPAPDATFAAERSVIAGNTVLYGATSGEAFFRGRAGERFAVRNSGAHAVVEGVGDHGCEYMTGGVVVVLGPVGVNFGAGMSGGIALVLDESGTFADLCNTDTVSIEVPTDEDADVLWGLLARHRELTGSAGAARLLAAWPASAELFVKVMPHDLRRALGGDDRLVEAAHA